MSGSPAPLSRRASCAPSPPACVSQQASWSYVGGLFVVVTWEEGGAERFRAGDELLLKRPGSA
ncbi:hypothetical protein [Streptomyces sp. NPDC088925]|uniref:hypothetical protein n=1 Tax=Streptomyces sp. NPDC088925 TaxID=3365914 RepID=UPI0038270781